VPRLSNWLKSELFSQIRSLRLCRLLGLPDSVSGSNFLDDSKLATCFPRDGQTDPPRL
jgi:hypothetical protein